MRAFAAVCVGARRSAILLPAAVLILLLVCNVAVSQGPSDADETRDARSSSQRAAEGLEAAFRSLLREVQGQASMTLRDVQSLAFWSERAMQARLSAATLRSQKSQPEAEKAGLLARSVESVFDAHIARLRQVEELADPLAVGGASDPVVRSAVQSLIVLAQQQRAMLVAFKESEANRKLQIVIPEASEPQPLTSGPAPLFVNIDVAGRYRVAGRPVGLDELQSLLRKAATNAPGRVTVIIRSDPESPFAAGVGAITACQKAGIRDYRFATDKDTSEK